MGGVRFWGTGKGLKVGGCGQDERVGFGTGVVAVHVTGAEKADGPRDGRDGQQNWPAKICHGETPLKARSVRQDY